jgi:hypothetical protein
LLDGDNGAKPLDVIDVRLTDLFQGLPGLRRQALDVFSMTLCSKHVENERRFPRTTDPGNTN